jgi:hypothetical protein
MAKKIVFWVGLLGTILLILLIFLVRADFCNSHNWCGKTLDAADLIGPNLLIFPIILFFSVLTYRMNELVFTHWFNFVRWYVIIFVLFTLFNLLNQNGGGDLGGIVSQWLSMVALIFLFSLFFIVSLIMIISKYRASKNLKI